MSTPENPEAAGPKEAEALQALDAAIEKVVAHVEDNDEQDASRIWDRVHELERRLQGAPSHAPRDALTGMPVDPASTTVNLGPADPVVKPEESGQAPSMPEGTPTLTDEVAPSQEQSSTGEVTGRRRSGES